VRVQLVVEAIGGEVAEESKVRNNCDNYDVQGTGNKKWYGVGIGELILDIILKHCNLTALS